MKEVKKFWTAWYAWLRQETNGYHTAVEFGAGFFDKLASVSCPVRIGIEEYKPYIDAAKFKDCKMLHGRMQDYRTLFMEHFLVDSPLEMPEPRVAIFIDSLEHITREEAFTLIAQVKEDFQKIVIMIPNGNIMQYKDVTGFDNDEGQTHKSRWFESDLAELGMQEILVDNNFHSDQEDKRSYFATWKKR